MTEFPLLIAIMGKTGSGKSSFINAIAGAVVADVGHGLQSESSNVVPHEIDYKGRKITLVDTPGFDDWRETTRTTRPLSNTDVLGKIADFMSQNVQDGRKFTGVIYAHNISEPRVGSSCARQMHLFREICGEGAMKNVTVVTTFWDYLAGDPATGEAREKDLTTLPGLLKQLKDNGAVFERSGKDPTTGKPLSYAPFATPQSIIDKIIKLDSTVLAFMDEVARNTKLLETGPGRLLDAQYEEEEKLSEDRIAQLEKELGLAKQRNENYHDLVAECAELREQVKRLQTEQQTLRNQPIPVPFGRRVWNFFRPHGKK